MPEGLRAERTPRRVRPSLRYRASGTPTKRTCAVLRWPAASVRGFGVSIFGRTPPRSRRPSAATCRPPPATPGSRRVSGCRQLWPPHYHHTMQQPPADPTTTRQHTRHTCARKRTFLFYSLFLVLHRASCIVASVRPAHLQPTHTPRTHRKRERDRMQPDERVRCWVQTRAKSSSRLLGLFLLLS